MRNFWFFDLDGTLADTDCDIRRSWKAAIADLGLDEGSFDEKFVAGPPINEMVKTLFPEIYSDGLVEKIRAGFARHYDNDGFPDTKEHPQMIDEVRRLKSSGDFVAVVTNKRFAGTMAIAEHFGWGNLFDAFFTGDMFGANGISDARSRCRRLGLEFPAQLRKPELLRIAISETGADRALSTMVGDTVNDFEAASANSIRSIAVPWGYGSEEELRQADIIAAPPFSSL